MSICGRVRGTRKCLLLSVVLLSVFVSLAQGKAPPRPKHPKLPLAARIAVIGPVSAGELRLTPPREENKE